MAKDAEIYYFRFPNCENREQKLKLLDTWKFEGLAFERVIPDDKNNWINQTDNDFDSFIPVCDKQVKLNKSQNAIFRLFSLGVVTSRDEWVYDFDKEFLTQKVNFFMDVYNNEIKRWDESDKSIKTNDFVDRTIKWTSELEDYLKKKEFLCFSEKNIVSSLYRPYIKKYLYFDKIITHRVYQNVAIFGFESKYKNIAIWFKCGMDWDFFVLSTNTICDILPQGGSDCLPLYFYDKDGNPHDNITDWALNQFQTHYSTDLSGFKNLKGLTKQDIFYYVYAVLHNPVYREKYEQNLKRDFPRIPFYKDFEQWAEYGKQLMDLHIGYESAPLFDLKRETVAAVKSPKAKLKADKERGIIVLDDNTVLTGIPIDAWDYKLGNRSALEWVLDQYKEKKPKDATIAEKFNCYRFADYKEQVIDLLMRVCTVSVETVRIVKVLATLE